MTEQPARGASTTANGVAFFRAVHQLLDHEPRVLDDAVILRLLDPAVTRTISARAVQMQGPYVRALRSHLVLRSRVAEDHLYDAVERGITQYVILGAGLDTFAFRQPAWARTLQLFEVDHPASQHAKRSRLAAAQLDTPANLTFAAIDFEAESLRDGLARNGVAFDQPAFFAWLGVTMYLTEDAIDSVLRTVAGFPSGSEIVLTFAHPDDNTCDKADIPSLAARAAAVGEPWLSFFTPPQLEAKLLSSGFSFAEFLTPEVAAAQYFQNRSDGLPPPRRINIAIARV